MANDDERAGTDGPDVPLHINNPWRDSDAIADGYGEDAAEDEPLLGASEQVGADWPGDERRNSWEGAADFEGLSWWQRPSVSSWLPSCTS
jgi:hypothetical protein